MTEDARRVRLAAPVRWVGLGLRAALRPPARAARGTARMVADPARQVVDYWASERTTMRQGFAAVLVASVTSLIAGVTLAAMQDRLSDIRGLFVLIPASIGMRGNIFGALSARLGTAIHAGLFEVSRNREGVLYQNVYAATLLTLATSVATGILAVSIAALLGIATASLWSLVLIALVGGVLSSAIVLAFTVVLSVTSSRRNWDLDAVGAPLITAIGDVVTLPCLLAASYLVEFEVLATAGGVIALAGGAAALYGGWTTGRAVARRIVRESFPVLAVAIVLDVLAGAVVEPRVEPVFGRYEALLVILPGFLENTGALGAILAARLGSKLHLGAVGASARPEPVALLDASIVLALGFVVYSLTAVTTLGLAELIGAAHPGAARFIGISMLAGLLATVVAAVIGYYAATTTFRLGLDPDNHTIPLVTSGMDLLGVICVVLALVVFGVA